MICLFRQCFLLFRMRTEQRSSLCIKLPTNHSRVPNGSGHSARGCKEENRSMFQRHPIQNGVPMFITTNTQNRRKVFANPAYAREAIDSLYRVQHFYPFLLFGFVIMPDHCHFLLKVPEPLSISTIMRVYKYGVTFNLGIGAFWQSRFHLLLPDDCWTILRHIHMNPVKAGLCATMEDYPWSSASGKWDISSLER